MKIAVFSDIHGRPNAMKLVVEAVQREHPDKVVFCGDLFGGEDSVVALMIPKIDSVTYFVRGNNDFCSHLVEGGMEENAVMYHFGRTLYFTHGHRYNSWRVPAFLKKGDAMIFGHTHLGSLTFRNNLHFLNVGSAALPRDGVACYLVLEEQGATLRTMQGEDIFNLPWQTP